MFRYDYALHPVLSPTASPRTLFLDSQAHVLAYQPYLEFVEHCDPFYKFLYGDSLNLSFSTYNYES